MTVRMSRYLTALLIAALGAATGSWFVWRSIPKPGAPALAGGSSTVSPARRAPDPPSARLGPIRFREAASDLESTFTSTSGRTDARHYPTANGSGVAILDYDGDGLMDIYALTGCFLAEPSAANRPTNQLYRQNAARRFEATTRPAQAAVSGYCQGVGAADVDNDGFSDVYLVTYGRNVFLQNCGDGTFRDQSAETGLDDPRWGTSCAFLDFDRDGDLDLYVANYGKWTLETNLLCGDKIKRIPMYCNPTDIPPESHALFRNEGDRTFRDVAKAAGVSRQLDAGKPLGRGQGVVSADVDRDGWPDLYVANDISPNFLFINQRDGTFRDESETSGAAFNAEGKAEASMGVDAADVDGDGWPELFVTNFYMEHNTLYFNARGKFFDDRSMACGVGAASLPRVGWGTALEDLDSDGWLDIFVTNGHVDDNIYLIDPNKSFDELPQLWRNLGRGQFEECSAGGGAYFQQKTVGRGAAFGDLDDDGDVDIVVNPQDRILAVLFNESRDARPAASRRHTVSFRLRGRISNRDVIGAELIFRLPGNEQVRQLKGGKSYLSAHDPRLHVGLGDSRSVDCEIRWPSGMVTTHIGLGADRLHTVVEPIQNHCE